MNGILALIDLILQWGARIASASALIMKARSEGRDVSEAELDALMADDDAARARQLEALQRAKDEGR